MGDPFAERPLRGICGIGVQAIVIAAEGRKQRHIGFGDGARRGDKLIADSVILVEAVLYP